MLKPALISAAGALALAVFALSPQSATAASLAGGASAAQAAEADLSNVVDVHRRGRHWRRHIWWGAPLVAAPFAYYGYNGGPGWHYQYFGPHKRRCGYTRWGYTCW
jgi:hypothetical protein